MPTFDKKTKVELETQVNDQAEQIKQMQITIKDLQDKIKLNEKKTVVNRNFLNEKYRKAAVNPQNIQEKLMDSGHSPDIQAQIMKNAN